MSINDKEVEKEFVDENSKLNISLPLGLRQKMIIDDFNKIISNIEKGSLDIKIVEDVFSNILNK